MTHAIFRLPRSIALDTSANPYAGAKLYFYATTTSTPQDTYTTSALNVAHANPVVADSAGVFPIIYLDPTLTYKLTYTTSADVLIYTQDPVNDVLLSQAVIGATLYPRSTAEISAGVTPTNYFRPYGDFVRFGAATNATGTVNVAAATAACASSTHAYLDDPGTYTFNAGFHVLSNSSLRIGAGVVLQAQGSTPFGSGGTDNAGIIKVHNRINVWIYGAGSVDGNKTNNPTGRIWGLDISGSTTVKVDGPLQFNNCPGQDSTGINQGDGICIRDNSSNIHIGAVVCNANVRQGISVVSCDGFVIDGATCSNTSGTAPGAGIDLEPDTPGSLKNGKLANVTCTGNYEGLLAVDIDKLSITNCRFANSRWNDLRFIRVTNFDIDNATIVESVAPTVAQTAIASFEDCQHGSIACRVIGTGTDAQEGAGLRLLTGCAHIDIAARVNASRGYALQIGQTGMAEDITDINVMSLKTLDCQADGTEPTIIISGDGTHDPIRVVFARDAVVVRDTRTGGNEAEWPVKVANTIATANQATYRVRCVSYGTTNKMDGVPLWGSVTWDPGSLVDAAGETSADITIVGAEVGDGVVVFPGVNPAGMLYSGYITATNTAKIRIQNETAGTIDLSSSTWTAHVMKAFE